MKQITNKDLAGRREVSEAWCRGQAGGTKGGKRKSKPFIYTI